MLFDAGSSQSCAEWWDYCSRGYSWLLWKKVKVGSSVCKFFPAGERLMIQRQTVVAIATQTLSTSCPSEAATQWGTLSDRLLMETVTWTPCSLPHTQQPNTHANTITHWLVPDGLFTQIHNYSRSGQTRGLSFHFLSLPGTSITEKCPPFALCLTSVFHSWPLLHYGN